MIYCLDHVDRIGEAEVQELFSFLSAERRETVSRYRFAKDRVQSALAYLLLRYGLIKDYGIFPVPQMGKTPQGKPYLQEYPQIHFNLSHCEKAVACGFAMGPIGIDVQHMVPYKESIAKFFMTAEERKQALLGDRDRLFTRLWTLKECYGKYSGSGICYPMSEMSVTEGQTQDGCLIQSHAMGSFYLSVCSQEPQTVEGISFEQLKDFYDQFLHSI